jgi:hypothetical protein
VTKKEYELVRRQLTATYDSDMKALARVWSMCGANGDDAAIDARSKAMKESWVRRKAKKKG